jgi:hypothetical protein
VTLRPSALPLLRAGLAFLLAVTTARARHAGHVVVSRNRLINRPLEVWAKPTARLGVGTTFHVLERFVSAYEGIDRSVAHLGLVPNDMSSPPKVLTEGDVQGATT